MKKGLVTFAENLKAEREKKPFVLIVTGGEDLNTSEETGLVTKSFFGDTQNRKAMLLGETNIESMAKALSENRDI